MAQQESGVHHEVVLNFLVNELQYTSHGQHKGQSGPLLSSVRLLVRGDLIHFWKFLVAQVRHLETVVKIRKNLAIQQSAENKEDSLNAMSSKSRWLVERISKESFQTRKERMTSVNNEKQKLQSDVSLLEGEIKKIQNWMRDAVRDLDQKKKLKQHLSNSIINSRGSLEVQLMLEERRIRTAVLLAAFAKTLRSSTVLNSHEMVNGGKQADELVSEMASKLRSEIGYPQDKHIVKNHYYRENQEITPSKGNSSYLSNFRSPKNLSPLQVSSRIGRVAPKSQEFVSYLSNRLLELANESQSENKEETATEFHLFRPSSSLSVTPPFSWKESEAQEEKEVDKLLREGQRAHFYQVKAVEAIWRESEALEVEINKISRNGREKKAGSFEVEEKLREQCTTLSRQLAGMRAANTLLAKQCEALKYSLEGGKESVREVAALAEKLRKNHSESLSSFPLTAALISQIKKSSEIARRTQAFFQTEVVRKFPPLLSKISSLLDSVLPLLEMESTFEYNFEPVEELEQCSDVFLVENKNLPLSLLNKPNWPVILASTELKLKGRSELWKSVGDEWKDLKELAMRSSEPLVPMLERKKVELKECLDSLYFQKNRAKLLLKQSES